MSNASLGASMLSVDFHDEESAYGSNSGQFNKINGNYIFYIIIRKHRESSHGD